MAPFRASINPNKSQDPAVPDVRSNVDFPPLLSKATSRFSALTGRIPPRRPAPKLAFSLPAPSTRVGHPYNTRASASKAAPTPAPSAPPARPLPPLLALPGELRNHIYGLVQSAGYVDVKAVARFIPSIAKVNKQIRREWMGLFHEHSHFMLHACHGLHSHKRFKDPPEHWKAWVSSLSDEDALRVKNLVFYSVKLVLKLEIFNSGKVKPLVVRKEYYLKDDREQYQEGLREKFDQGPDDRKEMLMWIGKVVTQEWV